jgi:hypothetical protein
MATIIAPLEACGIAAVEAAHWRRPAQPLQTLVTALLSAKPAIVGIANPGGFQ